MAVQTFDRTQHQHQSQLILRQVMPAISSFVGRLETPYKQCLRWDRKRATPSFIGCTPANFSDYNNEKRLPGQLVSCISTGCDTYQVEGLSWARAHSSAQARTGHNCLCHAHYAVTQVQHSGYSRWFDKGCVVFTVPNRPVPLVNANGAERWGRQPLQTRLIWVPMVWSARKHENPSQLPVVLMRACVSTKTTRLMAALVSRQQIVLFGGKCFLPVATLPGSQRGTANA